jgi:uncharacterized protein (TIGR02145 family)
MKTIILLIMLLFSVNVMQSQVRIGGISEAEKGAILDLNGTDYKGGLLLPKVEITDMSKIPAGFSDASVAGKPGMTALAGTLVWNTDSGKEGVYRWDGAKWNLLANECTAAPASGSITGLSTSYNEGDTIKLTCTATTSGLTLYIWTVPSGLKIISGNGTTKIQLEAVTTDIYPAGGISCAVINACGVTTARSSSDVTVTTALNPAIMPSGSGLLKGRTCFDIVETDYATGSTCGPKTSRSSNKADFTNQDIYVQTYTFTTSGSVGNLRFMVVDNDKCVESTSNKNQYADSPFSGDAYLTVNYKTALNRNLLGKNRNNAAVVTIYAIYNNDMEDVSVPLKVTIQDCACCGAYVAANTWKNFKCHNEGADESADPFTPSYAINGAYYQWGRKNTAVPAPAGENGSEPAFTWSSSIPSGYFGNNTDNGNVTAKSAYDPCPLGYRIPSYNEWNYLRQNNTKTNVGSWTSSTTSSWAGSKFGEGLMLPAAGGRDHSNGTLYNRGYRGYYWSTRLDSSTYAHFMLFSNSDASMSSGYRTNGFPIRCIAE